MRGIALRFAAVLMFATGIIPARAQAPDISGNWQGTYEAGKGLRTVLKISKADTGGWKAALYSIDQGGTPLQVTSITLDKLAVAFTIKPINVTYTGILSADGKSITGSA